MAVVKSRAAAAGWCKVGVRAASAALWAKIGSQVCCRGRDVAAERF